MSLFLLVFVIAVFKGSTAGAAILAAFVFGCIGNAALVVVDIIAPSSDEEW